MALTYTTAIILEALVNGYRYGFDIMDITGLPSGTVYPALRRMERSGQIVSKWEEAEIAEKEQRPPRKYYELTPLGNEVLAQAHKRYRLHEKMSVHPPGKEKPTK